MQTVIATCGACGRNACADCSRYPCDKPSRICFCDACSKTAEDEEEDGEDGRMD